MEIDTDVTIPILDEPITDNEIKLTFRAMKKPGFDYKLPILSILVTYFSFMLVNIMMFYVKYPVSLAYSLLSLIPRNFRGVQMMKCLACLYDRIIANRVKL